MEIHDAYGVITLADPKGAADFIREHIGPEVRDDALAVSELGHKIKSTEPIPAVPVLGLQTAYVAYIGRLDLLGFPWVATAYLPPLI